MCVVIQEPSKNLTSMLDSVGMSGNAYSKTYLPKCPGPRSRSDRFVSCSRYLLSRRFICLSLSQPILVPCP